MAKIVSIKGIDSLQRRIDGLIKLKNTKRAVIKATALVEGTAKSLAPVNKYSGGGDLRNKIHMRVEETAAGISGKVASHAEYSAFVEFGTGQIGAASSHPAKDKLGISYTPKESWVFTPDEGEHFYQTKGQKATPFMYPALKRNEKRIKAEINAALIADMGGK